MRQLLQKLRICFSLRRSRFSTGGASPRVIEYRWRTDDDDKREAERVEVERLRDEGKHVVSIGWGDPEGGKTIEHEASPERSNKD
jgi:hypothetical protein